VDGMVDYVTDMVTGVKMAVSGKETLSEPRRGLRIERVLINASGPDVRFCGITGHRKATLNK
jgi:hypothetical protein